MNADKNRRMTNCGGRSSGALAFSSRFQRIFERRRALYHRWILRSIRYFSPPVPLSLFSFLLFLSPSFSHPEHPILSHRSPSPHRTRWLIIARHDTCGNYQRDQRVTTYLYVIVSSAVPTYSCRSPNGNARELAEMPNNYVY